MADVQLSAQDTLTEAELDSAIIAVQAGTSKVWRKVTPAEMLTLLGVRPEIRQKVATSTVLPTDVTDAAQAILDGILGPRSAYVGMRWTPEADAPTEFQFDSTHYRLGLPRLPIENTSGIMVRSVVAGVPVAEFMRPWGADSRLQSWRLYCDIALTQRVNFFYSYDFRDYRTNPSGDRSEGAFIWFSRAVDILSADTTIEVYLMH